jgi:hypothetical protein
MMERDCQRGANAGGLPFLPLSPLEESDEQFNFACHSIFSIFLK